jgi:hypothetical protein
MLINDDSGDSGLHMGNKGGTSEDGAGDSTLGSLASTNSISSGNSNFLDFYFLTSFFTLFCGWCLQCAMLFTDLLIDYLSGFF